MPRRRLVRMDLPQALVLAILLHLAFLLGEELYPGLLLPWGEAVAEVPIEPQPLRFEFVDLPRELPPPDVVPDDAPASDRDRQASSAQLPEPLPESPDPISEGNTAQKVDTLAQLGEDTAMEPSEDSLPDDAPPQQEVPGQEPSDPLDEASQDDQQRDPADQENFPEDPDGFQEPSAEEIIEAQKAQAVRDAVRPPALRELGQRYDNITAAPKADFGSLSFETRGVDWGDYASRILAIIRANWIDRLPQAYFEGLRGRATMTFQIARDGSISGITLIAQSGVRPFDKVAEYSLEASSPLPPPPEAWLRLLRDRETVTLGFYYNMRPPPRN
jgi:outer membrane biosynthesis protein TonB